jgi:hypothetical protein
MYKLKQGIQYVLHKRKEYRIIYVRSMNDTFKGKTMMTKSERLVEALKTGEKLTAAQIKARFGIANPTATVSSLRLNGGYSIYGNPAKDSKGRAVTKYRLGTPSRAVIAAGYRALAQKA